MRLFERDFDPRKSGRLLREIGRARQRLLNKERRLLFRRPVLTLLLVLVLTLLIDLFLLFWRRVALLSVFSLICLLFLGIGVDFPVVFVLRVGFFLLLSWFGLFVLLLLAVPGFGRFSGLLPGSAFFLFALLGGLG